MIYVNSMQSTQVFLPDACLAVAPQLIRFRGRYSASFAERVAADPGGIEVLHGWHGDSSPVFIEESEGE